LVIVVTFKRSFHEIVLNFVSDPEHGHGAGATATDVNTAEVNVEILGVNVALLHPIHFGIHTNLALPSWLMEK
jgi:hypothetical protein